MSEIKTNLKLENIFLILFFSIMIWLCLGTIFDFKLNHPHPVGTLASDSYLHLHIGELIKRQGDYKFSSVSMGGGYDDVMGHYYATGGHFAAIFSYLTGMETYDSLLLIVGLSLVVSSLVFYLCIKKFNKTIAILSLPLMAFLFFPNFYFIFVWGQLAMLQATVFAILSLWCFYNLDKKGMWLLFSVSIAASFLSHSSEAMVFMVFYLVYGAIQLILKKDYKLFKIISISLIISFLLIFNFMIIFKQIILPFGAGGKFIDFGNGTTEYLRTATLSNFGLFLYLIIGGTITYLFFPLKKKLSIVLFFSIFILIWGHLNYIGGFVGSRSLPQRFIYPIYLSPLFGLCIYLIVNFFVKNKNLKLIALIISISLLIFSINFYYKPFYSYGLVDQEYWDMMKWIDESTPKNSSILFSYNDFYSQNSALFYTFRNTSIIELEEYINMAQSGYFNFSRFPKTKIIKEGAYELPYRSGLFKFGFYEKEDINAVGSLPRDLCSYDYLIIDKASRNQAFRTINLKLSEYLIKNGSFSNVYSNEELNVLKNGNKGRDCI